VRARSCRVAWIVLTVTVSTCSALAQTRSGSAPVQITGQVRYAAGGAPG
jgi:hypothetical protein